MSRLWYQDDLFGYDGLYTFTDLFNEYEKWERALNQYLIGVQVQDNEYSVQIYNMLFSVYRTHFFRYQDQGKIYLELSERLQRLYAEMEVGDYITNNSDKISGQTSINESYKTNNLTDETAPENNQRYRTNIETSKIDNGIVELELKDRLANNANRIQSFIKDMRNMFMNRTNEVQNKELYTRRF